MSIDHIQVSESDGDVRVATSSHDEVIIKFEEVSYVTPKSLQIQLDAIVARLIALESP